MRDTRKDWKQRHANECDKAVLHPIVQERLEVELFNLNRKDDDLARYGLRMLASYAAQVARAQALGFDPEALRLTRDEANAAMLDMAERLATKGVPVTIVEPAP